MNLFGIVLLYIFSLGTLGYTIYSYGFLPPGAAAYPEIQASFMAHEIGLYIHIAAIVLTLILGPLQFSVSLRAKSTTLHRWLGRMYFLGVLLGGLTGVYLALIVLNGLWVRTGFAILAILWLFSAFKSIRSIQHKKIFSHQLWMFRNFSLTLAAVTLRIYLPLAIIANIDFAIAYPVVAWLCWLPNILIAEILFNRR